MALSYNQETLQEQKLVLTPELSQSLQILHFSQLALKEYIDNAILSNPLLERPDQLLETFDAPVVTIHKASSDLPKEGSLPEEVRYYNTLTERVSLKEHLAGQIRCTKLPKELQTHIYALIDTLDANGYLPPNFHDDNNLSDIDQEAMNILQCLDPPGVGASSLCECLKLQLDAKEIICPITEAILNGHMYDLANNRLSKIAKSLQCSIDDVKESLAVIRCLDPRPGSHYTDIPLTPYIRPDVHVITREDGQLDVIIDEQSSCPKLILNPKYLDLLNTHKTDEKTMSYLKEKINEGAAIIKSIDQRKQTLKRVSLEIIKHQQLFFTEKEKELRPLKMKALADVLNLHESTISRAVNDKYLECSHGIYPLKHFFQQGLNNANGEETSAANLKNAIKALIDDEDQKKPLSDQKITEQLQESGEDISRRTVAKYRTQLGIPSASKRKAF